MTIRIAALAGALLAWSGVLMAADMPTDTGFDYYLLSTQWIPGWCQSGTAGKSGADLDAAQACRADLPPLMFHGLWPERKDGSYPHDCHAVPPLDAARLTFANPYRAYLRNADAFVDHEWGKHGTCTPYYQPGSEAHDATGYYRQVNRYFGDALAVFEQIKTPTLTETASIEEIKQRFADLNPRYPVTAQFATCDKNPQQKKFLTGLWLCVDAGMKAIACPAGLMKYENCQGDVLTH